MLQRVVGQKGQCFDILWLSECNLFKKFCSGAELPLGDQGSSPLQLKLRDVCYAIAHDLLDASENWIGSVRGSLIHGQESQARRQVRREGSNWVSPGTDFCDPTHAVHGACFRRRTWI